MPDQLTAGSNKEQKEFWNGRAGESWAEQNSQMDQSLRPFGALAIEAAGIRPGEKILDVGCGCGDTSFQLLEATGVEGHILAVDISSPMMEVANARRGALEPGLQQAITFELADASGYSFDAGAYDLIFSRFGVMFFDQPAGAFANLRKALKSDGRLAFICWAPVQQNEWITVPMAAALQHLTPPEPGPPNAPGPFGLSDAVYTRQVLNDAGYTNIHLEPVSPVMRLGQGQIQEDIADFFLNIGPVAHALAKGGVELTARVRDAISTALVPYYDGSTVNLRGSCWVVTADNG
ncbi:MAG: class I SAM-dependent methyltransferase [Halieaceae bacterium]|jgi:SAM-dependent methyltransferase|nr:class I SAM-dependent methyltransferase [Halieaceae bacterium]